MRLTPKELQEAMLDMRRQCPPIFVKPYPFKSDPKIVWLERLAAIQGISIIILAIAFIRIWHKLP